VIHKPGDWAELTLLDSNAGFLGDQLACLGYLKKALSQEEDPAPFIQTIFSPLSQAKNLVGSEELIVQMREHPEALKEGLETITESTIRFLESSIEKGIDGIFYAVQHATYTLMSELEYLEFGQPYDLRILAVSEQLWLNMLHLHGEHIMFDLFAGYPVQVINWHDRDTDPNLKSALSRFPGTLCGGLQRQTTMVLGTPESVRQEAMDALMATNGQRFILGTGCVLPTIAPRGNILAARYVVEA